MPDLLFTKRFFKIALPVMLGQILITGVSFIDNFMVGQLADASIALTAVMVTNEIFFVAMSVSLGVSIIGDIFGAQFYGANMIDKFKESLKLKLYLNMIFAVIFSVIVITLPTFFINIFISKSEVDYHLIAASIKKYSRIIAIAHLFFAFSNSFVGALTITGHPKYYLYATMASLTFNATFNSIFMYALDMGVEGAAYSTLAARILETVLIIYFVLLHRKVISIGKRFFTLDMKLLKGMMIRSNIILAQLAISVGLTGQTALWSKHYPEIQSSLGIAYAVSGILWSVITAYATSAKIIIGPLMGEGKLDEAYDDSRKILTLSIFTSIAIASIMIPTSFLIPLFFSLSKEAEKAMQQMIMFFSMFLPFWTIETYFFSLFESGGFTKTSAILGCYFVLFVVLPYAYLITMNETIPFWIAFFLTNALHAWTTFVGAAIVYTRKKWLRNIAHEHKEELNV